MIFPDLSLICALLKSHDLGGLERLIVQPQRKTKRANLLRSALMVSAINPRHLNRLDELEADIAVINLEDGVAPEQKSMALRLAGLFLSKLEKSHSKVVVRVNPLEAGGREEIAFLNPLRPDAIRVSKVKSPGEVEEIVKLVGEGIEVHLSIETKEAFLNLADLRPNQMVTTFYLGILDLCESLGVPQSILSVGNPTADYILSRFLVLSKSVGVLPVSFVYQDFRDLGGFEKLCEYEKAMGFSAKGCISPEQAKIANRIFGPSKEALKRAEMIKERFEEMAKKGITGFADETFGFVDEPIYKDALALLSMKEA